MKSRNLVWIVCFSLVVLFGLSQMTGAQEKTEPKKDDKVIKEGMMEPEDIGWRVRDFRPYVQAIRDLEKLNKEYSDNLLKLAIDEYSTGIDILEDMENEVLKSMTANKSKKFLNERFYWQEIDRKNQEVRQVWMKKQEAKMKAVTYLTKAINYLDQIQNIEVKQEPKFINFQTKLFQVYVSTQYDLQNFKPCIPILERYVTLSDKSKKDMWAYKYMSSCYGYMEKVLAKYRHANEDVINDFRNKKNSSMLTAVEIKYGIESPQYKHLQEIVEMDEKRAERINDYK